MTPDFTALRITYCSAAGSYVTRETIVLDAEMVDEYGYIEAGYVLPMSMNLKDARGQGTFVLDMVKDQLVEGG